MMPYSSIQCKTIENLVQSNLLCSLVYSVLCSVQWSVQCSAVQYRLEGIAAMQWSSGDVRVGGSCPPELRLLLTPPPSAPGADFARLA